MAFCNTCGTSLSPGTRFCSKCGAPVLSSSPAANVATPGTAAPAPPPGTVPVTSAPQTAQGGGALKVILIVVGVVILLGVLSVASIGFFAWRVAHNAHIRQDGNNVSVETPFGSVHTNQDPTEAARNLGVDLYPGVDVKKNGTSSATFGGVHTATVTAETNDSVDQVASFYKAKFPNAMVTSSDNGRCTIISNDHHNMVTVNIERAGDKTKIVIANVFHKSDKSDSSSN
jgi:hypothetical protein